LTKKCEFHQESETQLKSQVTLYTQKYEEFQSTLSKSNQVFESFRAEMDKLTKKIKKLEQENAQWKNKLEASEASVQKSIKQVRLNNNLCCCFFYLIFKHILNSIKNNLERRLGRKSKKIPGQSRHYGAIVSISSD